MTFFPVCLDFDGSVPLQGRVMARMRETVDFRKEENDARLWSSPDCVDRIRKEIAEIRTRTDGERLLALIGSGDLHHISLLLAESLPPAGEPLTLVMFDNHPDWFLDGRRHNCGNWVAGILELPAFSQIFLLGQNGDDLKWYYFYTAPFRDLCAGKIRVHPYNRTFTNVPCRKPCSQTRSAESRWWGSRVLFDPIAKRGTEAFFSTLAQELQGRAVYLSIDKDVLCNEAAVTDWDQGSMKLDELVEGIRLLVSSCNVVGADITGEHAPLPLKGFLKRLDSGRLFRKHLEVNEAIIRSSECVNLALLDALGAA